MSDELNKERLGKIVALAKHGEGGEKENAIRMVRSICARHGLDFDEVMSAGENRTEVFVRCSKTNWKLCLHVVVAYAYDGDATSDEVCPNMLHNRIYFKATKAKYIETLHAWAILARLYAKEQKRMKEALYHGFLGKHDLYAKIVPKPKGEQELSDEEMRARRMGGRLADTLEDADIRKTLPKGRK